MTDRAEPVPETSQADRTALPVHHAVPPGNRLTHLAMAMSVRIRDAALAGLYSTWFYGQTLRGPMPDHMVLYPKDLRPGSAEKADALFQGRWFLPGGQVKTDGGSPFLMEPPSETWAEELHGFSWLRHFTAAGGDAARTYAQTLVAGWIGQSGRWHPIGWRPHVIGRRLTSWVANGALIIDGSDLIYRSTLLRNMAQQARHLVRTAAFAPEGEPRLTAAFGLSFSALCLSEGQRRLPKGLRLLCTELDRQILPDGGHVSRNPAVVLQTILDLLSLRDALVARHVEVPRAMQDAIDRMMPMLRFFRHGDGQLSFFNGANEGPQGAIDAALKEDDAGGRPFGFAPHSGYQRLASGTSIVVADTGPPPPGRHSHAAHAGCLSFEMSAGKARLIVNCGATRILGEEWEAASRSTAAHSALVLADTSSARIIRGKVSRALLGARMMEGPTRVESRRNENEAGIWLDASHNGYEKLFGYIHRRRLFLTADGEELRGEDSLVAGEIKKPFLPWKKREALDDLGFTIRFHLHPDASASLAADGSNVLVRLANGDGWRFKARTAEGPCAITLEESVYLGSGEATRRAEQIVVTGQVFRENAQVNWAWRHASKKTGEKGAETVSEAEELPDLEGF